MRNSHQLYTDYPHISVLLQCLFQDTYFNHIRQQSPLNRRLSINPMCFLLYCITTVAVLLHNKNHFIRVTTLISLIRNQPVLHNRKYGKRELNPQAWATYFTHPIVFSWKYLLYKYNHKKIKVLKKPKVSWQNPYCGKSILTVC